MTQPSKRLPLEGVKVADFTWALAGPLVTKYMAVYGADVIKVESNSRVDNVRIGPPFVGKPSRNSSAFFANFNPSKRSISLNMKAPKAKESVARRLVEWSDILVENFAAGQMGAWGMDYETLRQTNPGLIMLSSSQQGQKGPHASHPGLGQLLMGLAGVIHFTGWPDRPPTGPAVPYPDLIAPWFSLASIMAALDYRDRTGKGQFLDLSQLESSIQFLAPQVLDYSVNDREGGRVGNYSDEAAPHNAYRCQGEQRWCAISVRGDEQWKALTIVLGDPAWTQEPRFRTHLGRLKNLDEMDSHINEWTKQRPAEEVMHLMQEAGVPAAVVSDGRDIFEDPQLGHRGHSVFLEHGDRGTFVYDAPSFRVSGLDPVWREAPRLGGHTEEIVKDVLGFSEAEYTEMSEAGVFI